MAGIFKKAYDQADRMLNTSGISSLPVVYKQKGSNIFSDDDLLSDEDRLLKPKDSLKETLKKEWANLLGGKEITSYYNQKEVPDTKLNKFVSDILADIATTTTAPVGTDVGISKYIPGIGPLLQPGADAIRSVVRGVVQNPDFRTSLGRLDKPELGYTSEEYPTSTDLPGSQKLYLDQWSPDKVVDGKRYYTPVTDETKSKYFSEADQEAIGDRLGGEVDEVLGFTKEGLKGQRYDTKLGISEPPTDTDAYRALGNFYYGSYDSEGKWQEGVPNWDGTFTVRDVYDWNRDMPTGPAAILQGLGLLRNPEGRKQFNTFRLAEAIAQTGGPQASRGEGRKIKFNVPTYTDDSRHSKRTGISGANLLTDVMGRLNNPFYKHYNVSEEYPTAPWNEELPPQLSQTSQQESDDFDPETAYTGITDFSYGMKHGGQTMSRGLSGINKTININGQPHSLAWINPDEASALKAMGGSGKKVGGIPAYYYEDADEDFAPTYDQYQDFAADMGHSAASANVNYENFAESYPTSGQTYGTTITSDTPTHTSVPAAPDSYWGYEPEPDFGQTGPGFLGSDATEDDAKSLWMTQYIQSGRPRHDPVSQEPIDIEEEYQKARNAPGGLQAIARGYQIGDPLGEQMRNSFNLVNQQLQNRFTERGMQKLEFTQDEITREELQDAAKDLVTDFEPYDGLRYPIWMPGGLAGQALNFFSRTVIGTGTVGGVGVHVHEDGTVTPISPEDSPGFDHESMRGENIPRRYRPRLEDKVSVSETITEKEPTGIAALLARRSDKPGIGQSLQPQFDNLASIFGRDKAAEMLGQPVNIFA